MGNNKILTNSDWETEKLGEKLSAQLDKNDIIALCGPLGAGKTCFVRGICRGLKITESVHSPTFALLNVYTTGIFNVYHFDMYRINTYDELLEIGFEEYVNNNGICIIEWAEKILEFLPNNRKLVEFEYTDTNKRKILLSNFT